MYKILKVFYSVTLEKKTETLQPKIKSENRNLLINAFFDIFYALLINRLNLKSSVY